MIEDSVLTLLLEDIEQQKRLKKFSTLITGGTTVLRPLDQSDEKLFKAFFQSQIPENEVDNLRHNVRDPLVVDSWIRDLDYRHVLPIIALNEGSGSITAVASLHFLGGIERHIAEVRIVVGKDYRKIGLGSVMIKEVVRIGNELRLYHLKAKIPTVNKSAVKAFRQLGFEVKCTLEDYFMTRSGTVRDVALMMKRLKINWEDDLFMEF